jgi:type I restriction enzyme S subunit
LAEGESLYTNETHLPATDESDTVVVADGSRSGLAIRGMRGILGSTLLAYKAREGIDPDYLFYILESLYLFNNTATIGGAIPHLDKQLLAMLTLATPEFDEQHRIAAALKLADDAIQKARAELEAARNVKSALVAQLLAERSEKWSKTKFSALLAEPIRNGYSPVCPQDPTGAWVLGLDALTETGFNPDGVKPAPVGDEGLLPFRLKTNDILVSRSALLRWQRRINGLRRYFVKNCAEQQN